MQSDSFPSPLPADPLCPQPGKGEGASDGDGKEKQQLNHPSYDQITLPVIKPPFPRQPHLLPAGLHDDPKLRAWSLGGGSGGAFSLLPPSPFSLLQTAQGRGSRVRQVWHKSPRLIAAAAKGERSTLQCVKGLVPWLQESMALAQLLPTLTALFDPGNMQAAFNMQYAGSHQHLTLLTCKPLSQVHVYSGMSFLPRLSCLRGSMQAAKGRKAAGSSRRRISV